MSNVLKKLVQNGTEYSIPQEIIWIPESVITKSTTKTYGVDPYNTSYYYTNFQIAADAGIEWKEGVLYIVDWNTFSVASAYRNVRFMIGTGDYIPLMNASGTILSGYTYCKKAYTRPYFYSTKYQSGGALHLLQDDNSTYSSMSIDEGQTGTATTGRVLTAANLKSLIEYHAGNLHDSTKQDILTAGSNVSISSNTISSDSTSILTQTEYNNLPSSKNSDNKTYFICETIS